MDSDDDDGGGFGFPSSSAHHCFDLWRLRVSIPGHLSADPLDYSLRCYQVGLLSRNTHAAECLHTLLNLTSDRSTPGTSGVKVFGFFSHKQIVQINCIVC